MSRLTSSPASAPASATLLVSKLAPALPSYTLSEAARPEHVIVAGFTVCCRTGETLLLKLLLPAYWTVIQTGESVTAKRFVVKVACRAPSRFVVHRTTSPFRNVMLPLGVPAPTLVTVAVNVTEFP